MSKELIMAEKALSNHTYEAYLALEGQGETKYEFHDGYITAMAGGSPEHGQISGNFIRSVGSQLQAADKRCIIYTSDVKIHIKSTRRTFYPDSSIICSQPQKSELDPYAITNPLLILEVLSDTTADFDRGAKFHQYRQIPSFREYVLVSQKVPQVDIYYRKNEDLWEIMTYTKLEDSILLKSINIEIGLQDIYWLVEGLESNIEK